jgi:hypothetical protein
MYMSHDPYSGYGSNPYNNPQDPSSQQPQQNPYGQPPQQQDPYGQPPQQQNPYEQPQQPPQSPYGMPPQEQYGVPPQSPYGMPPQEQYGVPPQNPYGMPPQGQYGVPPQGQYGAPGYGAPVFTPLPLNEAVQQLPTQYQKVLTKPSVAAFVEELPKAAWDITWIQLLIYIVIRVVVGLIVGLVVAAVVHASLASNPYSTATSLFSAATTTSSALMQIISVPAGFFIIAGLQYLFAKAFGGQGTFLGQCYTSLLFVVPLGIISSILAILAAIPVAGSILASLIGLAIAIYQIVLNVFQIQAAHRLTGGKATAVVLLPYVIIFVLIMICAIAFAALFVSMLHGLPQQSPQP